MPGDRAGPTASVPPRRWWPPRPSSPGPRQPTREQARTSVPPGGATARSIPATICGRDPNLAGVAYLVSAVSSPKRSGGDLGGGGAADVEQQARIVGLGRGRLVDPNRSERRIATTVLSRPCSRGTPMPRSVASDSAAMTSAVRTRSLPGAAFPGTFFPILSRGSARPAGALHHSRLGSCPDSKHASRSSRERTAEPGIS